MTPSYVCHDWVICVLWLLLMCAMTQSYVCYDSFLWVAWLIHRCAMTLSYVCHDSFICVPWLMHISGVPHSCVGHELFICVPWLIHTCDIIRTCDMTQSMWAMTHPSDHPSDSITCDMNHSHVNDSLICSFICGTWTIHMGHDSFIHMWRGSFICGTNHPCLHWLTHMWYFSTLYMDGLIWFIHTRTLSLIVTYLSYIWIDSHDSFVYGLTQSYVIGPVYILIMNVFTWLRLIWIESLLSGVLQSVAECCSVLQSVAVCCSILWCVAVHMRQHSRMW